MSNRKLTNEEFINRSMEVHGDKYDYSETNYVNTRTKVKIICPQHGVFVQLSKNHLAGTGCPSCSGLLKLTNELFIEKSIEVHGDKYDYSLTEYTNNKGKVKIICPEHGVFEQVAQSHMSGIGCSSCSGRKKLSTKDFIIISKDIHNDKYDYSLTEYSNNSTKVKIICPEHGVFEQVPKSHVKGHGCPSCNTSKGEEEVKVVLDNMGVKYVQQHTFDNCIYKKPLRFDFYLPEHNLCVEYDGKQHFEPHYKDVNGVEFEKTKIRDKIKNDYCRDNNIKLLRIKYDEIIDVERIKKNI